MKNKLISAMLVSSTVATSIISSGGTTVLATDDLIQPDKDEINIFHNTTEDNDNISKEVDGSITKPEINYAQDENNEEVNENEQLEDSEETQIEEENKEDVEADKDIDSNQDTSGEESDEVDHTDEVSEEVTTEVTTEEITSEKVKTTDGPEIKAEDVFKVKHNIMGSSEVTKAGFKAFFADIAKKNGYTYKLNCTIEELVDLAYEEASIEGVRADIVIAQGIWETGYFQYGGIISPDDNNYAGIGAVGTPGVKEKFETPRIGLRAQVQHLKAYASTSPLNQTCVDPRFGYVTRGSAPSLEELAGKWAVPGYNTSKYKSLKEAADSNDTYGQSIYRIIEQAKKYNGSPEVAPDNNGGSNPGGDSSNTETPTLVSKGVVVNVTSALNVRSTASSTASVVATLRPNQKVNIYGESNGWYKVDYISNGVTKYGYCSKEYISINDEVAPPAIVPPPSVTNKTGIVSTTSGVLNVRSGAGTNYSVIGSLSKGKEFEITGESGNWYKINYSGKTGYVSKDYVKIKSEGTNPPSPSYKKGTVINVSSNLNVRTSPSTSSSVVGYLLNGTVVKVIVETNGWYKIIFNSSVGEKEGYVSGQYLKVQ